MILYNAVFQIFSGLGNIRRASRHLKIVLGQNFIKPFRVLIGFAGIAGVKTKLWFKVFQTYLGSRLYSQAELAQNFIVVQRTTFFFRRGKPSQSCEVRRWYI